MIADQVLAALFFGENRCACKAAESQALAGIAHVATKPISEYRAIAGPGNAWSTNANGCSQCAAGALLSSEHLCVHMVALANFQPGKYRGFL